MPIRVAPILLSFIVFGEVLEKFRAEHCKEAADTAGGIPDDTAEVKLLAVRLWPAGREQGAVPATAPGGG